MRTAAVLVALLCSSDALVAPGPARLGGGRRALATRSARSAAPAVEMAATLPALRRVVVTGMGICSSLGNSLDEVADSLYHAKSGIKFMPKYAELGMKSQVAGRPSLDLDKGEEVKVIDRKSARFMGENAKYAYIAMNDAIIDVYSLALASAESRHERAVARSSSESRESMLMARARTCESS